MGPREAGHILTASFMDVGMQTADNKDMKTYAPDVCLMYGCAVGRRLACLDMARLDMARMMW